MNKKNYTRRKFVKLSAATVGEAALISGLGLPREALGAEPE